MDEALRRTDHHPGKRLRRSPAILRTTLDPDDDLLGAGKHLARRKVATPGQAASEVARQSLAATAPSTLRNEVPLFPPSPRAPKPGPRTVNRLREED